jgi:hypothetical protein
MHLTDQIKPLHCLAQYWRFCWTKDRSLGTFGSRSMSIVATTPIVSPHTGTLQVIRTSVSLSRIQRWEWSDGNICMVVILFDRMLLQTVSMLQYRFARMRAIQSLRSKALMKPSFLASSRGYVQPLVV